MRLQAVIRAVFENDRERVLVHRGAHGLLSSPRVSSTHKLLLQDGRLD